jgi:L-alanine-DL-glutamate epimerase-like enolase superfamily enzyme
LTAPTGQELPPRAAALPADLINPLLAGLSPPARCGLDLALHDWWGKRLAQPLHRLWGLDPGACVATSVTLGLGETAAVLARLERWWLQLPATRIKLKLGSPDGVEHDRALVIAVAERLRQRQQQCGGTCELQVDANGGWDLETAQAMAPWLAEQGGAAGTAPGSPSTTQAPIRRASRRSSPIARCRWWPTKAAGTAATWSGWRPTLMASTSSCSNAAACTRPWAMAREAHARGLRVMAGCYGDSSLLNGAAAQLLALIDWPDLDSHLNLIDDPFTGLATDALTGSGPHRVRGWGIRWRDPALAAASSG